MQLGAMHANESVLLERIQAAEATRQQLMRQIDESNSAVVTATQK